MDEWLGSKKQREEREREELSVRMRDERQRCLRWPPDRPK
jgi:hypothetical protein